MFYFWRRSQSRSEDPPFWLRCWQSWGAVAARRVPAPPRPSGSERPLCPARWHHGALTLPHSGASRSHVTRFWLEVTPRDSPGRVRPGPARPRRKRQQRRLRFPLSPHGQLCPQEGPGKPLAGPLQATPAPPPPRNSKSQQRPVACGPRPPEGHSLAADQQLPSQDSRHARRGPDPSTDRRPPHPARREGAGGAWRGHLPRPRPALSSAHRAAFAGRPVCSAPLPAVTPSGSPLLSAPGAWTLDEWVLSERGTMPELSLGRRRAGKGWGPDEHGHPLLFLGSP